MSRAPHISTIIDLVWEGPFPVNWDRDGDRYTLDSVPVDLLQACGVYQIYGLHPVYGPDVLLYIGETKSKSKFQGRLKDHISKRFFSFAGLAIYLAPCTEVKRIPIVESILISTHMPALNIRNINRAQRGSETLLVRNWGTPGSLQSACTGAWLDA